MARIRTLKPEVCLSEPLADCDIAARYLYVMMQPHCDDSGIHQARPRTLRAEVFPHDENVTAAQVGAWMEQLIAAGLIVEYDVLGERYWFVKDWANLQKVEKPNPRFPRPDADGATIVQRNATEPSPISGSTIADESPTDPQPIADLSPTTRDESPADGRKDGREGKGVEGKEYSEAIASAVPAVQTALLPGVEVAQPSAMTAKARAFELGRALLGEKAGSLLAKWAKTYGDDLLAECLADAVGEEPHDPKSWMVKALEFRAAQCNRGSPGDGAAAIPAWLAGTGFATVWAAESAGCGPGNAKQFREGRRVAA